MSPLQALAVPVAFLLGCFVGVTLLSVTVIVALLRANIKDATDGDPRIGIIVRAAGAPSTTGKRAES